MSRPSTEQLDGVLRGGSFTIDVTFDVYYGTTRVLGDVPATDWSFDGDIDAEIPHAGKLTAVYQGDFAESFTPRDVTDALAPFGQRVIPYFTVSAGQFKHRLQVGVYEIADVPSGRDSFIRHNGRELVTGSVVELELLDLFRRVKRARFRSIQQPASLTSTWTEIVRITGLPVTRTVADQPIPATVTYDRSRIDTLAMLASNLGGRPVMLADGTFGVIPDAPGTVAARYEIGDEGVILDVGYSLPGDVPNVIVGDFEDTNGNPIHVEAATLDGALAVTGPYGENVVDYPDDLKQLINSQAAAQKAVDDYLAQRQKAARPQVPVDALIDPRRELGDVIELERPDRLLTTRVLKYSFAKDSAMQLTVEVLADEQIA